MVDLSLFSDWKYCNACGLPADQKPDDTSSCCSPTKNDHHHSPKKKPPSKLMACADCSCVAYHDASCQKSHWRKAHKRECKELASAILPLKELIRWHKMHKKMKKSNLEMLEAVVMTTTTTMIENNSHDAANILNNNNSNNSNATNNGEATTNSNPDQGTSSSSSGAAAPIIPPLSPPPTTTTTTPTGKYVWCWWEPDNENGITPQTLHLSNTTWNNGVQKWNEADYLVAMESFQTSLEIYRRAWPYIGKSSGTNERRSDADMATFFDRSLLLAKKLLFCAYCELDASMVDSARQRLVQCLSIAMTIFFTTGSRAGREAIRNVMSDAWMELMLSMEEIPQHRLIARHVATMAIATKSCGWTDPLQRPGFMAGAAAHHPPCSSNNNSRIFLASVPYTPREHHPAWCRVLENNWIRIVNEYNQLIANPFNFSNVGNGRRGSGHDDHLVVSGRSWKEYVLFGTGAKDGDEDAPFTKQLLRINIPDAISLAEAGGGEVIFSVLSPRTRIKSHCGPTNLRYTAHLGLVVPDNARDCRIRVRDAWHSWFPGKVLLFDDSYEHEVRNDTDETRVVLLLRVWHPQLSGMPQQQNVLLGEAMVRKEAEVKKRFHPPCG